MKPKKHNTTQNSSLPNQANRSSHESATGFLVLAPIDTTVSASEHIAEVQAAQRQIRDSSPVLTPTADIAVGCQSLRLSEDEDAVKYLAVRYKEGAPDIPPIVVRREGEKWIVVDGRIRLRAALAAGVECLPCIELNCSESCALALALVGNARHGCRLNRYEIKANVKTLLKAMPSVLQEIDGKPSYRELATHWGVSKDTVHRAVHELRAELKTKPIPPPDTGSKVQPSQGVREQGASAKSAEREQTSATKKNPTPRSGSRATRPKETSRVAPALKPADNTEFITMAREYVRMTKAIATVAGVHETDVFQYVLGVLLGHDEQGHEINGQDSSPDAHNAS